jgi:hypothetical protein
MRQRSQFNGPRLTDKLEALLRTRPETPFLAMNGDVAEQLSYGNPLKSADEVVCLPCSQRWLPCRSAPAGTS